ncbi:hypothetical protein DZC78_01280 [Olleya aquimaris]|nr:hypothetical protein DZC78_01280 [Olleya aquimaris]
MEHFLHQNYSFLTKFFILIAVVSGIVSYRKYKGTPAIFFIKIVLFLFLIEVIGSYYKLKGLHNFFDPIFSSVFKKNFWWYTLAFDVVVIVLFSVLFQKVIANKKFKKILKFTTYCFILFSSIHIFYNRDLFFIQFFPMIQIAGAFVILSCSILYFMELLLTNKILKFYKFIYFYIAIAIFIWWLVITPLTFYDVYMVNSDWEYIFLKWQIYLTLNFVMYMLFAIGFFVSKPQNLPKKN